MNMEYEPFPVVCGKFCNLNMRGYAVCGGVSDGKMLLDVAPADICVNLSCSEGELENFWLMLPGAKGVEYGGDGLLLHCGYI